MIQSYRSKALLRFMAHNDTAKLSVPNVARVERLLSWLDAARLPDEMNLPGLHFHSLKGRDKGRYAINVSANWRITFGWNGPDAIEVDLEDYH